MAAVLGCAAPAAHASLGVPTGGPPATFSGAGTGTANALASFEAAIGGADNGTSAGEQGSGFRRVGWDTVALDGSEPGSTAIPGGHTVAVSRSRLEPWGIELGPEIAVADDGFHSVNSGAQFTPFTTPNVWAPFNSNTAEFEIVAPEGQSATPAPAVSRGLGGVFLNVSQANTTEIQYYNGDILLGHVFAPVDAGGPSFAALLFADPVVTRVVVTLGTGAIFSFDGSSAAAGPSTSDLVAGDDVALAEPAPARGALTATAGVPLTAALDAFTESNPNATPHAAIDWGDGTSTTGTITTGAGGTFLVAGDHAYARPGSYLAQVTVDDASGPEQTREITVAVGSRATATALTCSPTAVAVSAITTCSATVSDAAGVGASAPSGLVSFASPTPAAAFPQSGACLLGPTAVAGVSSCSIQFTPGQLPPSQARLSASYAGDATHAASAGATAVAVHLQRCTLHALTHRLRAQGLGLLVTCDARAGVHITARAVVARRARFRGFQLQFGTVGSSIAAGRPTVLVLRPGRGVLPVLRAAVRRHQRVTLKLTLTATSHATTRRTTTRVSALRLP